MLFGIFGKKNKQDTPVKEPISMDGMRIFFMGGQQDAAEFAATLTDSWTLKLDEDRKVDLKGLQEELAVTQGADIGAFFVEEDTGSIAVSYEMPELESGEIDTDELVWFALAD